MEYRSKIRRLLFIVFLLLLGCRPQYSDKTPPKVIDGEIDLTHWDFKKDGPVKLDGQWLFSWEKQIQVAPWVDLKAELTQSSSLPSAWRTLPIFNEKGKQQGPYVGYATYAAKISGINNRNFDLMTQDVREAATMYSLTSGGKVINVVSKGKPSINRQEEQPVRFSSLVGSTKSYQRDSLVKDIVLLIHVSSFHHAEGGFFKSIIIDAEGKLVTAANTKQNQDAFLAGVFFVLAIFHFILFYQRPNDKSLLWFGIFCLGMKIYLFCSGVAQAQGLGRDLQSYVILEKLIFIMVALLPVSLLMYFQQMFPSERFRRYSTVLFYYSLPLVGFPLFVNDTVILTSNDHFYYVLIIAGVLGILAYLTYKLFKSKSREIGWVLLSVGFILVGSGNDILNDMGHIQTLSLGPMSVLFFLIIQSSIISKRNAEAHERAENLTKEMTQKVEEQTKRINHVQHLSQSIQNTSDLKRMQSNLKTTLYNEFGIEAYNFYVLGEGGKRLYLHSLETDIEIPEDVLREIYQNSLEVDDPRCIHGAVMKRAKPLYLPRLLSVENSPAEIRVRELMGITSLYLIPLIMDKDVYGFLSLTDFKYQSKARIKSLTKDDRLNLELLGEYVSSSFYQALQKEKIRKVQENLEKQTSKLNRIQFLSQRVQNTSDLQAMKTSLKKILEVEWNIRDFIFYVMNGDDSKLKPYSLDFEVVVPDKVKDELFNNYFELNDPRCTHAAVVSRGKSFFAKNLGNRKQSTAETYVRAILGIQSIFIIPLKMDNQVFATLSFSDIKYQSSARIKELSKTEREDLETLSKFIAPALYQALQKEEVQRAQEDASRAKNEAAINQIAAHLAHEVNNPLNYIATGKTIQNEIFSKFYNLVNDTLTGEDEDLKKFKAQLTKLQEKFNNAIDQTDEGQARITKVVAEIRAITGVDGLNFSNFDLVPIINEELIYSLQRNQVKSGEQSVRVTGTNESLLVQSNPHILARSIRTVISNCIHFARAHKGNEGEINIDCKINKKMLLMDIGNNSFSIKNENLDDIFDLERSQAYGTEQIGLAMIKELLLKIGCDLVLADHGRESGKVTFQLQVPLET